MARPLLICSALLFLFPSLLAAQHHVVMVAPAPRPLTTPAPVPTVAITAPHRPASAPSPVRSGAPHNRIRPTSSPSQRSQTQFFSDNFDDQVSDFPVPGLGFDAVHFAATHPNVSNHRHHGSNFLIPLFGGEYYYPYPVTTENPAQNASQTSDDQDEDLVSEDRPRRRRTTEAAPVQTPAPEQAVESPGNSDEYIFVRRDGSVFFAVAYSWDRKTLRYITQQGLRQSLSSDSLDLDATYRFNEQRGLTFRPPV